MGGPTSPNLHPHARFPLRRQTSRLCDGCGCLGRVGGQRHSQGQLPTSSGQFVAPSIPVTSSLPNALLASHRFFSWPVSPCRLLLLLPILWPVGRDPASWHPLLPLSAGPTTCLSLTSSQAAPCPFGPPVALPRLDPPSTLTPAPFPLRSPISEAVTSSVRLNHRLG